MVMAASGSSERKYCQRRGGGQRLTSTSRRLMERSTARPTTTGTNSDPPCCRETDDRAYDCWGSLGGDQIPGLPLPIAQGHDCFGQHQAPGGGGAHFKAQLGCEWIIPRRVHGLIQPQSLGIWGLVKVEFVPQPWLPPHLAWPSEGYHRWPPPATCPHAGAAVPPGQ